MTIEWTPMTTERMCPDGYPLKHVPLSTIRFLDPAAVKAAAAGPEAKRYAAYKEVIEMGHAVNGAIIVYRNAKGKLFASDLRHSELVVLARRNAQFPAAIVAIAKPLAIPGDPYVSVKIIDVENVADIPAKRAKYLEAQK